MAPKQKTPTIDLSSDAAAMEAKLAELRKAMDKERAKRETLMAQNGGSIWKNGANGLLRSNFRSKQGDAGGPGQKAYSPGSLETSPDKAPAAPQRASSASRAMSVTPEPVEPPTVSGSRLEVQKPMARRADVLIVEGPDTGMGTGTDSGPGLMAGNFNEADSHKSFLEALQEWRRGTRSDAAGGDNGAAVAGKGAVTGNTAGAAMEVQTEVRQPARPASGKLSYFDKLVLNSNSRQAAELAAGASATGRGASGSGAPAPAAAVATDPMRAASAGAAPALLSPSPPPARASSARPRPSAGSAGMQRTSGDVDGGSSSAEGSPEAVSAAAAASGQADDDFGGASTGTSTNPLAILDKLEALELRKQQHQQQLDDEDDDDECAAGPHGSRSSLVITTQVGVVLTKNTRLPDDVLLPSNED